MQIRQEKNLQRKDIRDSVHFNQNKEQKDGNKNMWNRKLSAGTSCYE